MRAHVHAYARALFISQSKHVASTHAHFSAFARWAEPRNCAFRGSLLV